MGNGTHIRARGTRRLTALTAMAVVVASAGLAFEPHAVHAAQGSPSRQTVDAVQEATGASAVAENPAATGPTHASSVTTVTAVTAVTASTASAATYHPLTPARILDTREGLGIAAHLGDGASADLAVTGHGGVPADGVAAVVLNLTATNATGPTYVTAWPAGTDRPLASNLNVVAGQDVPNLVIVPVGTTGATAGTVSLYNNHGSVDLVADVEGWFAVGSEYTPLSPTRIMDTRTGLGVSTAVSAHATVDLQVAGHGGVPATGVGAVVVNLTATNPTEASYVTAWPTGVAQPVASNLNVVADQTSPNLVIVPLGEGGRISLYNNAGDVHLVADVEGWFAASSGMGGSKYSALTPTRILDTRTGLGIATPLGGPATAELQVTGQGGVPATGVSAVVVNVTATNTSAPTYVTVWPTGVAQPVASNLNVVAGQTSPNLVIVPVGAGGKISFYNNNGTVDLVADVQGWFASSTDGSGGPEPGDAASHWAIRPASVLLSAGETAEVSLVGLNADGTTFDATPASDVTVASAGGGSSAEYVGNNTLRLTAGSTPGTTVFAVKPAGETVPTAVSASVVSLRPGVQQLADDAIVFPVPYAPSDGDLAALLGTDYSAAGIAGFTFDELAARTHVPSGDDSLDLANPAATDSYTPLIVRGDGPPVGTLILTAGGSGTTGRVIEPSGAPTVHRNGLTLLTVGMVQLKDLYSQLVYDIDAPSIAALGLPVQTVSQSSAASRGAADRQSPADDDGGLDCEVVGGRASVQVNQVTPQMVLNISDIAIDVEHEHYRFAPKFTGTITGGFTVTLQGSLTAQCEFPLTEETAIDELIPLGPLTGLLSATLNFQAIAKASITIKGGPKVTWAVNCQLGGTATVGFDSRPDGFQNLSGFEPIFTCPDKLPKYESGLNNGGVSLSLDISGGVFLRTILGGRIGGAISKGVGKLFNNPKLGVTEVLKGDLGPNINFFEENSSNVIAEQKSSTKLRLTVKGTLSVNAAGYSKIKRALSGTDGAVDVSLFSKELPIITAYEAPSATAVEYSLNGDAFKPLETGGLVYVEPGDHVRVRATLNDNLAKASVDKVLKHTDGYQPDDTFDDGAADGPGYIEVENDVSVDDCGPTTEFDDPPVFDYRILGKADAALFGWDLGFDVPIWGGAFKTQCVLGRMRFKPTQVLNFDQLTMVDLESRGKSDPDHWHVESKPAFVDDIDPSAGDWHFSGKEWVPTSLALTHIDRPEDACYAPGTGDIVVVSEHRGNAKLHIEEPDPCYMKFEEQAAPSGPGLKIVHVLTKGFVADEWEVDMSTVPDWITNIVPPSRTLPVTDTEQRLSLGFTVEAREPTCSVQLPEMADLTLLSGTRGKTSIKVTLEKVPRSTSPDCGPSTGSGTGDPHMRSFDGGYYEGQVRGEYVYARSTPGADVDIEVRARQEPSRVGVVVYPVTSVTAAAIRVGDHQVEVYTRTPEGQVSPFPRVFIDGVETETDEGVPIDVAPDLSFVRVGFVVTISAPTMQITAYEGFGILNLSVSADRGAPIRGMLGTPNGDVGDDFVTSDGLTQFSLNQIYVPANLRTFTDSWRIAPADTIFSESYVGNDDENPPVDPDAFAPFQAQAQQLLASLDSVCDLQASVDSHLLDGLAYELAIGRTSRDLSTYSCSYVVRGTALSGDSPIPGLSVNVDVPGLGPCTTTTASDGRYVCLMAPDLDEVLANPPTLPLAVTVEARFAGGGAVVASASSAFATKALVAGAAEGVFVDLSIDPSLLPNLNVSGTMLQAGQPSPDPVSVNIKGYDASDHLLVELVQTVAPNPVDGSYAFTKVLPIGATRATIMAAVGLECCPASDYPTVNPSGLHNGPNAVAFSFDDNPPVVGFTGAMTGVGGAALAGPITVSYQTFNGATIVNSGAVSVSPAGGDGSYTIPPIRLPRTATSVKVTAEVGVAPSDFPTQTFPVEVGTSTKTFNVSYIPPTLSISGNLTKGGAALAGPVDVRVTSYNASNVQLGAVQVVHISSIDPSTGAYTVAPFAIPVGTKRVSAHAQLGVIQTPFTTRELTNVPATGNSALDMSFDFNPSIITVTGTAKKNGSAYTQQFGVQLLSYFGVDLFTQLQVATPDANGVYSVVFEAPVGTFKIRAIAQIGPAANEYPTTGDITSVAPGAQNLPFDINYNTPEVVVSGNLTDAAGNAMPAGQRVELTGYDDTTGTHQIFSTSVNVDPAAGTGHYEVSITVPTTTLSVRPAVRIGPLSDKIAGPLAQVTIGNANQITLNAVYNPPILKLHGTMTQPGGTPYTGAVFIRVQSKDSGGVLLADQFWTAHLDANGFYNDIAVTLPLATTTVVITPQAGAAQNWLAVTKAVVPGVNDFLLDVVQNLPRLHLSGIAKRNNVNINTSFGVKIEALNGSGAVLQTLNTGVTAVNGAYSLTWDAPLATVSARVTADVSPFAFDDVVQTFTGIQNGVNELTLDFDDSSKRLQMSGTVTADGVPYHGVVTFYVNYGHGSPRVQDALQSYDVPTDAAGHYALDAVIPDASTQGFVDAMVPTGFGSSTAPVSTQVTGMTLPINTLAFDAAYVPLHLLLSGTITIDGTPPSGTVPVLFSILTDNNQTFTKTVQVDPDDITGHYDVSVAEPFNAATATATIEVGPAYDWFVSDPITLADAADTPATLDAIYDPVFLSFTGRIRDAGVAADDIRFTVRSVTGNNVSATIGPDTVVTPDATGAFSTVSMTVPYPRTADSLQISVNYHLVGDAVLQRHEFGTGIDIADPPHDETLTVNRDTQVVDVTGVTVDGNGDPHLYDNLVVSTGEFDAGHNGLGGSGFILGYGDLAGSFTMHLEPNQNAATIEISIGGGPVVVVDVTHNVDAFHTTADIGDYEISTGATLRISGGFTMGEDPDTGMPIGPDSVRIVVTPYTFDKDDWQDDPPYAHNGPPIEIAAEDVTVGDDPDHDEEFFTTTHIPADTNLIDVQYFVDDDPLPYRSGYLLDPDDQNPLVQYFDYGGPQVQTVEVHTTFGHYNAGPPANCGIYTDSPFIVHLTAVTYAVADPSHTRSVFNGLIVPDPDDVDDGAVVPIRVPVEPGHDKIDFSDDTTDIYTDAHMSWSGSTGQPLDPGNTISTFVGRGCNPFDPQP